VATDDLQLIDAAIRRKRALLRALERGSDTEMAHRLRPELERLELKASALRGPPEERLRALLVRAFSADELWSFLRRTFGAELAASLQREPLNQLVDESIWALERRGWINDDLRRDLCKERPALAEEIGAIFASMQRGSL
jgi:hypothetical protein